MSVVGIGDLYFVTALRAAGVVGRAVGSIQEAEQVVDELVKEGRCKVLLVPSQLAADLKRKREELARHKVQYPVFAIIPGMQGETEERTKEIYQLISQAVGARLKLSED